MRKLPLVIAAALLLIPLVGRTQGDVNNPAGVEFVASIDHATVDGYDLDILRPDSTVLQTINLGKPTPNASQVINAPLNVQPIAFGNGYSVRVRARAGTAFSDYSVSTNKFNRIPGAPSKLTLR